ncbi:MAG: hypothetical protein HUK40_09890 [Desulfobacter sp.]|nr:hypothetical protein [Desulfobacter sp.]WDP84370.1 MAG: hypothetical protein HUN05_03740 [Desulfobacter sp.]
MIQRLSSIRLTYYSLWILVLVLALGTGLSLNQKEIFKALNHGDLYTWLAMVWQDYPLAAAWFLALGLIAVCLLANGICCCLSRQLVPARPLPLPHIRSR